jgi:hypothetical protein
MGVQCPRDTRPVRVVQSNDSVQAARKQKLDDLIRSQSVPDGPSVLVEPLPDGREDLFRKKVYMGINNRRKKRGHRGSFRIVQDR